MRFSLPNLHFSFTHYIKLMFCFFFNFKIFSMFYFGWLLIFSLFFMTADCISFVWVHLAFFFLSVQVKIKKKNQKRTKKKSLHELERPARTFYNDLFSLLMSRLKKQKGPVVLGDCSYRWKEENISQLLRINSQSGLGSASKKKTQTQFNPLFPPWPPAAECSSFHQVAPLVFTVYGLSSSACLIPLVRINTCFKLLVNKTEHRYECVIKRWENGRCRLLVVFVCLFRENIGFNNIDHKSQVLI